MTVSLFEELGRYLRFSCAEDVALLIPVYFLPFSSSITLNLFSSELSKQDPDSDELSALPEAILSDSLSLSSGNCCLALETSFAGYISSFFLIYFF